VPIGAHQGVAHPLAEDAGAQFEKGELVERPDDMTTTEEAA
jgi:hypothetical protein